MPIGALVIQVKASKSTPTCLAGDQSYKDGSEKDTKESQKM